MRFLNFRSTKTDWWQFVLLTSLVIGCIALFVQLLLLYQHLQQEDEQAVAFGQTQLDKIGQRLEATLIEVERMTHRFALDLESGKMSQVELTNRLKQESKKHEFFLGFTVAYEPFAFDSKKRLYAPYYDSHRRKLFQCEEFYDYTDPANEEVARWYLKAAHSGKPVWVSGYGPVARSTYAGYSVPIYVRDKDENPVKLLGVVNVALSLQELSGLLNTRFIGRLGTGLMIDRSGVLLAHPVDRHLKAGQTLLGVLQNAPGGNDAIYQMARDMANGKSDIFRFKNYPRLGTQQSGWIFYKPIQLADWSIGVVIFESELYHNETSLHRRCIWISLTLFFCIVLVPALFIRTDRFDLFRISVVVVIYVISGTMVICYLWYLKLSEQVHSSPDSARYHTSTDLQGLDEYIQQQSLMAEKLHSPAPQVVPTRLLIRTLEIDDSYKAKVGGYLWQTYRLNDGLTRGFKFPDVTADADSIAIEQVFNEVDTEAGIEVRGWEFRVILPQRFDFSMFPFDAQHIVITITHPDIAKNVLLVPELSSYRFLNTSAKPGLHSDLQILGWKKKGSYFRHHLSRYDVESGMPGRSDFVDFPELQFNIVLQRNFLTPFISYIIPMMIVSSLLYGVTLLSSIKIDKREVSGFNIFGVLGTCGAFFFTVALMHIDLRNTINASVVTYLESLYVVVYVLLVLVSLNSLLFMATDAVPWIEYRDNILAKLLYWPLIVGLVLTVTLFNFY